MFQPSQNILVVDDPRWMAEENPWKPTSIISWDSVPPLRPIVYAVKPVAQHTSGAPTSLVLTGLPVHSSDPSLLWPSTDASAPPKISRGDLAEKPAMPESGCPQLQVGQGILLHFFIYHYIYRNWDLLPSHNLSELRSITLYCHHQSSAWSTTVNPLQWSPSLQVRTRNLMRRKKSIPQLHHQFL